jgi:hypothetical protein
MNPRIKLIRTISEIKQLKDTGKKILELEKYNFDFSYLHRKIDNFYNLLIFRKINFDEKIIAGKRIVEYSNKLISAKRLLEDCINLLKGSFEIESNTYLQHVNKTFQTYTHLRTFVGVLTSRIDEKSDRGLDWAGRTADLNSLVNIKSVIWIEDLKNMLIHFMESLIIIPLENAVEKFNSLRDYSIKREEKTEKIIRDADLFFYILFLEFFRVAEVEGSTVRQNINQGKTEIGRTPEFDKYRSIPENIKTQVEEKEELINEIRDPFVEEEENTI